MEVPDLNKMGEILLENCFPVCIFFCFFDIFIASLSINLNIHQADKNICSISSNLSSINFSPQEVIFVFSCQILKPNVSWHEVKLWWIWSCNGKILGVVTKSTTKWLPRKKDTTVRPQLDSNAVVVWEGCRNTHISYTYWCSSITQSSWRNYNYWRGLTLLLYLNIDSYSITGIRTTSQCISTFSTWCCCFVFVNWPTLC